MKIKETQGKFCMQVKFPGGLKNEKNVEYFVRSLFHMAMTEVIWLIANLQHLPILYRYLADKRELQKKYDNLIVMTTTTQGSEQMH